MTKRSLITLIKKTLIISYTAINQSIIQILLSIFVFCFPVKVSVVFCKKLPTCCEFNLKQGHISANGNSLEIKFIFLTHFLPV